MGIVSKIQGGTIVGGASGKLISDAVITLDSNTLTYDGTEKTKTVTSVVYNSTTLTVNTDYKVFQNKGTDAGSYTLMVVGIGEYSGIATIPWSIAKATPTITLDVNEISITPVATTGEIVVTTNSNGTITATSSDTEVCTVSIDGNVVTVTGVANGDATVSISVGATTNYNASVETCDVDVLLLIPLNTATPAQIQQYTQAGFASTVWAIGDKTAAIPIASFANYTASTNVCAYIIGFDHNSTIEGTGITFQFGFVDNVRVALVDSGYGSSKTSGTYFNMNNSTFGTGGWNGSRMRSTLIPLFLAALPQDWQNVISTTTKYTDNTGTTSDTASYVTSTEDKIFLLAEFEIFGTRSTANSAEQNYQEQYKYYADGNSRINYRSNATTSTAIWYTRSPNKDIEGMFNYILASGANSNGNSAYSRGFAPAFRVG